MASLGLALPLKRAFSAFNIPDMTLQNSPFYHFTVGTFKATIIADGQALFPAYPLYAVNASKEVVESALYQHFLPTDNYLLQCNCLYLENSQERILIDTGAGNTLGDGFGNLPQNLKKLGISKAQITAILLTHCHLDHIGGLMVNGQKAFPNATIYLSEQEWKFWSAQEIDLSSMPIEASFRKNFKDTANKNLQPLKKQIQTFKFGEEILSGIQTVKAIGHSPGHTCFLIGRGNDLLMHTGDIFHHPAFDLAHPNWTTAFDQDAQQAYKTRIKLLDMVATERIRVMSYHTPFPALGHLKKKENFYKWVAAPWRIE